MTDKEIRAHLVSVTEGLDHLEVSLRSTVLMIS